MANIVFDVLVQYNIADKLFCITTDNAGNNGTLCRTLEGLLENADVIWDHAVFPSYFISLIFFRNVISLVLHILSISLFKIV